MKAISSAVGRQALNAEVDQTTVRDLLNKVAPSDGGPMSRLSAPLRDRVVSAALQAAIEKSHGLPAADQITTFLGTKTRNPLWLDLFNKNSALNAQLFQEFFGRELGMRTLDGLLR